MGADKAGGGKAGVLKGAGQRKASIIGHNGSVKSKEELSHED